MREIQQVVANQLVRRLVMQVSRQVAPVRVLAGKIVGQRSLIGAGGITHPDEHPAITNENRVRADTNLRRNLQYAGYLDTTARRIEMQAVIHAADIVPLTPPEGQWCVPMTTSVRECYDIAVRCPVEQYRPVQHTPRQQCRFRHLVAPGDHVPAVVQVHGLTANRVNALIRSPSYSASRGQLTPDCRQVSREMKPCSSDVSAETCSRSRSRSRRQLAQRRYGVEASECRLFAFRDKVLEKKRVVRIVLMEV